MIYKQNMPVLLSVSIMLFTPTISIPAKNSTTKNLDSISKQVEEIFAKADELTTLRKQRSRDYLNSLPDEELAKVYANATVSQQISSSGMSGFSKATLERIKKDRKSIIEELLKNSTPLSRQESKDFRRRYTKLVDDLAAMGPAAIPVMSLHMGEKYRRTEHWALAKEALQKMGAGAVEPLIDLMDNPDESLRQNVIYVLYRLGDARAKNAFLTALDDESNAVRKYAVEGLKQLGPDTVGHEKLVAVLIDHLEDSACIRECITGLEKYGDETAIEPLSVIERFYPVRTTAKKYDLRYPARQAINAILTRVGKPVKKVSREDDTQKDSSYDDLCDAVQCPNAAVRSSAIAWLDQYKNDQSALFLIERIKEEQNPAVLDQITRTFRSIIIPPKGSTEPVVSQQVMQKAFDTFISKAVKTPPQNVKAKIATIQGCRGVLFAASLLRLPLTNIEQFKKVVHADLSSIQEVRIASYSAITSIATINPETSKSWTPAERKELQQELAPMLDLPNPNIRLIECLGFIGDKRLTPRLIELLGDDDSNIRRFAAHALGQIGDTRALPVLEQLAETDQYQYENGVYSVREAARNAIEQIKKNPPDDIKDSIIINRNID